MFRNGRLQASLCDGIGLDVTVRLEPDHHKAGSNAVLAVVTNQTPHTFGFGGDPAATQMSIPTTGWTR